MSLQLDCAHGESGINGLRQAYQTLLDSNAGLEQTNEWLDSEDEILARMPLLRREQIKVSTRNIVLLHLPLAYKCPEGLESGLQSRWWMAGRRQGDQRNWRISAHRGSQFWLW